MAGDVSNCAELARRAVTLLKGNVSGELESPMELTLALQYAGRNPSPATVIKHWNRQRDAMSVSELAAVLEALPPADLDELTKAFRKFDRNADGRISLQELRRRLQRRDESLTDEDIQEIFDEMDANQDGVINYKEFVSHVESTRGAVSEAAERLVEKRGAPKVPESLRNGHASAQRPDTAHGPRDTGRSSSSSAKESLKSGSRRPSKQGNNSTQALVHHADKAEPGSRRSSRGGGSRDESRKSSLASSTHKSSRRSSHESSARPAPEFFLPPPPPKEELTPRREGDPKEEDETPRGEPGPTADPPSRTSLPSSRLKPPPDQARLRDWQMARRRGAFFRDEEGALIGQRFVARLERADLVWFSLAASLPPDAPNSAKLHDVLLVVIDRSSGLVVHVTGEADGEGASHGRLRLEAGDYELVPWTSGLRFPHKDPKDVKRRAQLLEENTPNNKHRITKAFKMALMNVFDLFDSDESGTLSREEFSLYSVHTGDGPATEQEWSLIKQNFEMREGELTLRGFVGLHAMEAEDGEGETEDLWLSLHAAGYNDALQMDAAAPFTLSAFSEDFPIRLGLKGMERLVGTSAWDALAGYVESRGERSSPQRDLEAVVLSGASWALGLLSPFPNASIAASQAEIEVDDAAGNTEFGEPGLSSQRPWRMLWMLPKRIQEPWEFQITAKR